MTDLTDCLQTFVESHSDKNNDKPKDDDRVMTNALIDVAGREGAITLFRGSKFRITFKFRYEFVIYLFITYTLLASEIYFSGYEEMKQKLGNHLKRLADEGREVKKEDIDQFFEQLETERKRRREDILSQL